MTTKEQLVVLLEEHDGEYLSGSAIAQQLGVTRAAVWKQIQQLQEEGYQIEAVQNRGYRLGELNDVVSAYKIRKFLGDYADWIPIEAHPQVTSTNQLLKDQAAQAQAPDWYTIIAGCQTEGRGRRTRNFFSPSDSGVYLSTLLRLPIPAEEALRITIAAAVAACRAIEECTDARPQIKWVNDVYISGKKICGILTEASISMESGGLDWAVMGIGLNVYEPEGGFPGDLREIAGPICTSRKKDLRCRLSAAFLRQFYDICRNLMAPSLVEEYRQRSFLPGHTVDVLKGDRKIPAFVEGIDQECRLLVRYEDGSREALSSGEVSIKVSARDEA